MWFLQIFTGFLLINGIKSKVLFTNELSEVFAPFVSEEKSSAIVNGRKASQGQFPYQVLITDNIGTEEASPYCGGSLITTKHVLTAAHCVNTSLQVLLGQSSLSITPESIIRNVIDAEKYEQWSDAGWRDIAILTLDEEVDIDGEHIQTIPIGLGEVEPEATCIVSGWGYQYDYIPVGSSDLLYTLVDVIDVETCKLNYNGGISDVDPIICAQNHRGRITDGCQGDSGGPLAYKGALVGIVSWGFGCGESGKPGIYTKVSPYGAWIKSRLPDVEFILLDD